ncbi:T9SS type B sorting domain-containing protein [Tenacibaculum haliotis]|uniref:T9SS type B sorting domain-containing protein n=1 Tax=Tenacibaculum haliotis TaxID=1888914 RepID=UPI0021AF9BF6|nr:T9SS type B sorting domain-containing protein [Tenacibaculum haliotis]MCT4699562.1 T9SS type B sorting domain-containing protein [Tenacibaculum haliotis]
MKKIIILLLILFPSIILSQDGGTTCDTSEPMCSDNSGVKIFNNTTNTPDNGSTACLYSTPNPSWFYIKVESTGNLEFEIIQSTDFDTNGNPTGTSIDVDFAAWGPFNTSNSNCTSLAKECIDSSGNSILCPDNITSPNFYTNNLDNTNIIDCSYSGSSRENFTINNAQAGEFYVLLITNFDNLSGKIKLEQTNFTNTGSGTTDCSIVSGELGPDQETCDDTTVVLDGTPTVGTVTNYEWQVDTGTGFTTILGENNATLTINNNLSGTYKSIITDNLGNKGSDDVVINFLPLPVIANTIVTLNQCDTDTDLITDINLTLAEKNISANYLNETFKYYPTENDAINDTSEITNQTAHSVSDGDMIWVRTISDKNCYQISKIEITVGYQANITYTKQFTNCDDYLDPDGNNTINNNDTDGITYFDLSTVESDIKATFPLIKRPNLEVLIFETITDRNAVINNITNTTNYRNKNVPAITPQPLYIKIIDKTNNNCEGLGNFTIWTQPLPDFIVYSPVIVCLNNPQTRLEPINPNATYSYEWTLKGNSTVLSTNAFYDVTVGGTYVITATKQDGTGCKRSREIVVNESINPTLTSDDIVIIDDTNNNGQNNYAVKIITKNQNLGIGDYEFAITDEDNNITGFQDEPLFDNISGGFYTVLVRDKNGCQPDATIEISVIEYPKFLTPNGDGKNDTWKIKGANSSFYPSSNITIVDRYGKIVAIIPIDNQGWDGTYKGKLLPSNDYWFKIYLVDRKGKVHQHQGHFSLLRK